MDIPVSTMKNSACKRKQKSPGWGKKILFSALICCLFFVALETTLWLIGVAPYFNRNDPLVGFSGYAPLFVEQTAPDGSRVYVTAPNKVGIFNRQQFPVNKSKKTYRIFCMGGSTTFGHPFDHATSFAGWLNEFLAIADPSRTWEVINAGGISYASYRVAKLMEELSTYKPDMFIIYSGHNEFLEKRSYGPLAALPDFLLDLNVLASRTRIYSALSRGIEMIAPAGLMQGGKRYQMTGEVQEILSHAKGPSTYTRNDQLHKQIQTHYRLNLERMVSLARMAGSDILLVNPPVNARDMSPFHSQHRDGLTHDEKTRWETLYASAIDFQKKEEHQEAIALFAQAEEIDHRYADLLFRYGQSLFAAGHYTEAKKMFSRAIDEDICQLRIQSPMHDAVLETARRNDVPIVDLVALLEADSLSRYGHDILGREYFLDHVHPTIEVNRQLALTILNLLVERKTASPGPDWGETEILAISQRIKQGIDANKTAWALRTLGDVLGWAGKIEESHALYMQAHEILGDHPDLLVNIGISSLRLQRFDTALEFFEKALTMDPDMGSVQYKIGSLYEQQGQRDRAILHYNEALRVGEVKKIPLENLLELHKKLAALYSAGNEYTKAGDHFRALRALRPDDERISLQYGHFLLETSEISAAKTVFSEVASKNPKSAEAHYYLALILEGENRFPEAIAALEKTLQLDPGSADGHTSMGSILMRLGRRKEAADHFSAALAIDPANATALGYLRAAQEE